MKTITTNIYQYDELSDEAKKTAIEWGQCLTEYIDLDLIRYHESLMELGYSNPEINYSGFWSQGDGACFTCKVDIKKWVKVHKKYNEYRKVYAQADNCNLVIKTNGKYYHEYTMYTDSEAYGMSEAVHDEMAILEKDVIDHARKEAHRIYRELEREYMSMTSDEAIIDMIRSNEYNFTADGMRTMTV